MNVELPSPPFVDTLTAPQETKIVTELGKQIGDKALKEFLDGKIKVEVSKDK